MALSAVLTSACLFSLALPLAQGGARLAAVGVARWAWGLASQAAWEYLAAQLLAPPTSLPMPPLANATLAVTVPALLQEAVPPANAAQAVGTAWTWACLALAAWRKTQTRR